MTTDLTQRNEPRIDVAQFQAVEMRVGRVIHAEPNEKARVPAYQMRVDFGQEFGVKTTSAQLTSNYTVDELIGRLVIAVMNFPPRRVAGVKSEVLVLAAVDDANGVVLLHPDREVRLGARIL